jgi:frataxin-like iron-binding protein CyaY
VQWKTNVLAYVGPTHPMRAAWLAAPAADSKFRYPERRWSFADNRNLAGTLVGNPHPKSGTVN